MQKRMLLKSLLFVLLTTVNIYALSCTFSPDRLYGSPGQNFTVNVSTSCSPGETARFLYYACFGNTHIDYSVNGSSCGNYLFNCSSGIIGRHVISAAFYTTLTGSDAYASCRTPEGNFNSEVYVGYSPIITDVHIDTTHNTATLSGKVVDNTGAPLTANVSLGYVHQNILIREENQIGDHFEFHLTGLDPLGNYAYVLSSCSLDNYENCYNKNGNFQTLQTPSATPTPTAVATPTPSPSIAPSPTPPSTSPLPNMVKLSLNGPKTVTKGAIALISVTVDNNAEARRVDLKLLDFYGGKSTKIYEEMNLELKENERVARSVEWGTKEAAVGNHELRAELIPIGSINPIGSQKLDAEVKAGSDSECKHLSYCNGDQLTSFGFEDGACVQKPAVLCIADGCLRAKCEPEVGCTFRPDNSLCSDQCMENELKVSALCIQSGKRGICNYESLECSEDLACKPQSFSCAGKNYYCARKGAAYVWSDTLRDCGSRGNNVISPLPAIVSPIYRPKSLEEQKELEESGTESEVISVIKFVTEHEIIRDTVQEHVGVYTNSPQNIVKLVCAFSENSGSCSCEPGYDGSGKNFQCTMEPLVNGIYAITLLTSDKKIRRLELALEPGKRGVINVVKITKTENVGLYGLALLVSSALVFIAIYVVARKVYLKRKLEVQIFREREMIPKQKDNLKFKLMKGEISPEDFRSAFASLEKRESEIGARIKEYYEKNPSGKSA